MKYSVILATAFVAVATAQDLSAIPTCAVKCINDAVASTTSCTAGDVACICENKKAVVDAATACVLDACGFDVAVGEVLPATDKLCAAPAPGDGDDSDNGDDDDTPTEPEPSVTPPAAEPTTSSPPAVSSGPVVTVPTTVSTTICSSSTLVPSSSLPPKNATISTKPPAPIVTAGAAAFGAVGSFGLLVLGAAVAL